MYETCVNYNMHVYIYIYTLLHLCTSGLGEYVSPKGQTFPEVIQQGDLAMPRWLIFRLPATRFFKHSILSENWPNVNGKELQIVEVPWKWVEHDTILFLHPPKKIERWLKHHASRQLTTWRAVGSSRPVLWNTIYRMALADMVVFWLKINCHDVMRKKRVWYEFYW